MPPGFPMATAIRPGPIRPITASQGPAQQPMPTEMPYRAAQARRAGHSPSPVARPAGQEPTILRATRSKEAVLLTRVPAAQAEAAHTAVRALQAEAAARTAVPAALPEAAVPTAAAALPAAAAVPTAAAAPPAAAAPLWVAVPQEEAVP